MLQFEVCVLQVRLKLAALFVKIMGYCVTATTVLGICLPTKCIGEDVDVYACNLEDIDAGEQLYVCLQKYHENLTYMHEWNEDFDDKRHEPHTVIYFKEKNQSVERWGRSGYHKEAAFAKVSDFMPSPTEKEILFKVAKHFGVKEELQVVTFLQAD